MSLLLAALLFVPLLPWDVRCRAVLLHPMGTAKLLSSPPCWQCCATGFNYYLTWDSEIPHYLAACLKYKKSLEWVGLFFLPGLLFINCKNTQIWPLLVLQEGCLGCPALLAPRWGAGWGAQAGVSSYRQAPCLESQSMLSCRMLAALGC